MGVRLTSSEQKTALFDSVTNTAFGPVFDTEDEAEDFLKTLNGLDPRALTERELAEAYNQWYDAYYTAKEKVQVILLQARHLRKDHSL